ncbi:hypothetical protein J6590_105555 [Homalodisca vitripennis]|nr:hypothetical protein J6590_105555 [Homalodisca vitripennis]
MNICSACEDPVPSLEECCVCSVNNCILHFECANITEYNWKRWGQKRRSEWKCKDCQIDGVPELEKETMPDVLSKVAEIIQEPIDYIKDIQACHRVPTKNKTGVKPIVVQFVNRKKRNLVLAKAKENRDRLKSTAFVNNVPQAKVFVGEHLTAYNKDLLYKTKKLRDLGYQYVWFREGKVFVRWDHTSRTVVVTCEEDVERMMKGGRAT